MVLKRKLPTQEKKQDKKIEKIETENQFDDFDMSIEAEEQAKVTEPEEGHDLNNDFPDQIEDKPEDFIPAELRALEETGVLTDDTPVVEQTKEPAEPVVEETPTQNFETAEDVFENVKLKQEQENADVAPVDFDMNISEENLAPEAVEETEITENVDEGFETIINSDAAPAELPESQEIIEEPVEIAEPVEEVIEEPVETAEPVEEPAVDFENHEHADWSEVTEETEGQDHTDENFEGFETVSWDNPVEPVATEEIKDENLEEDEDISLDDGEDLFGGDNGGIVPEIPGLDDFQGDTPAEVMGENSKELKLSDEAKKKLIAGVAVGALVIGGIFVASNMDSTTEVANRWSGSLTEASQDIAETEQEQEKLKEEGVDVTQTEDVIDFSELSSDESENVDETTIEEAQVEETDTETEVEDPATEINLLDPESVETTASGKEIIKATGEEEIPEDVEEGANLITNITAEIERQKAAKKGIEDLNDETSEEDKKDEVVESTDGDEDVADLNKKVDNQLAEYRKLLAQEEDPGKKVKPGKFFSGQYNKEQGEDVDTSSPEPSSLNVSRVSLNQGQTPADYVATNQQIDGHKIVEYPKGVARQPDQGIRTLDHFRSLLVEKEDKRVRMPRGVKPGLRTQGFPQFKVISIVPNYGLIGEYNNTKGILMIGDTFKGWELVGVYESYAEFKLDNRKHIISLK